MKQWFLKIQHQKTQETKLNVDKVNMIKIVNFYAPKGPHQKSKKKKKSKKTIHKSIFVNPYYLLTSLHL